MGGDEGTRRYEVFIAYPSAERTAADELYRQLVEGGCSVFLDHVELRLGDHWPARLAEAQQAARVTVVIISSATDAAFYQWDEIARGIALSRRGQHRVVPVYLDDEADPLYGLLAIHVARASEGRDFGPIAAQIRAFIGRRGEPSDDRELPQLVRVASPTPRRSPFRPGMPLYATDRYPEASRRSLLHAVADRVRRGSNVNLVGDRRTDRTSLLNHLYARLLAQPGTVVTGSTPRTESRRRRGSGGCSCGPSLNPRRAPERSANAAEGSSTGTRLQATARCARRSAPHGRGPQ